MSCFEVLPCMTFCNPSSFAKTMHSCASPLVPVSTSCCRALFVMLSSSFSCIFLMYWSFFPAILHFMGIIPMSQFMIAFVVCAGRCQCCCCHCCFCQCCCCQCCCCQCGCCCQC